MNKQQLGSLILESQESLYRVAKSLLSNDADCGDAICETIARAFEKLHTLKSDAFAKTWLTRILINECHNILRREKKIVYLEDYAEKEETQEQQDYSELYEAIRRLPEEGRLAIVLYYMEGYRVKEIAGIMKTTESAVKKRLARAREKLRIYLEAAEM